jgi:N6-L-threonylcarbamoyladenine synthase
MSKIKPNFTILAIDTSCDETAAAITVGQRVLSNIIWSQIEVHRPWGGVVPDLARKEHQKHLGQVIDLAIKRANTTSKRFKLPWKINWQTIDAIAVTQGPGLAIALEVGIKKAKELAQKHRKPLIAVNHMEGHLLSPLARNSKSQTPNLKLKLPALGLLVSGGHTQLVLINQIGNYQLLGETLDDAAGEAFDKVAKMLNLGYPGGPIIEELARKGDPHRFELPIPMARDPSVNFSFSGLKTACLYKIRSIPESKKNRQFYCDFAASFQRVLAKAITIKLKKALEFYRPKQLFLGGGVISNLYLRREIRKTARKYQIPVLIPYSPRLLTDNAAMIGIAAFYKAQRGKFVKDISNLDRKPNLNF